jgi:hypothetical protein
MVECLYVWVLMCCAMISGSLRFDDILAMGWVGGLAYEG